MYFNAIGRSRKKYKSRIQQNSYDINSFFMKY